MRQTKIIATVGPASDDAATLERLIEAGASVFRLNFSHGTPEQHARAVRNVRAAAKRRGACVAILGDLAGPKVRLGAIPRGPRALKAGQKLRIVRESNPRGADRVGTNHPALVDEVRAGHRILIDDGRVRLRAVKALRHELQCVCEVGGPISTAKGVNLPDTPLSLPAMTDKDHQDLEWAAAQKLDYVALSFVRRARDVDALRDAMRSLDARIPVVAKIEKPEAVECLSEIIDACDVLLVARGDLGVEMDVERVPLLQKTIARQCVYAGRPVIIATQMLQSMVDQPAPTRAEVSDVANAILDSADAVMLSAETAVGRHPVEAVAMAHRIAEQTEPMMHRLAQALNLEVFAASMRVTSSVARGAALLARDLSARLVAVWTQAGSTPRLLSKHRLSVPIVGIAPDEAVARRMAMFYGVTPLVMADDAPEAEMIARLDRILVQRGLARPGEMSLLIMGTQLTQPGSTNSLLIHLVGES